MVQYGWMEDMTETQGILSEISQSKKTNTVWGA